LTNRQYWFRLRDEPRFTFPGAEALAKSEILLPNGMIIKVERDTLPTKIIRGVILAQQNGRPFSKRDIDNLVSYPFNNANNTAIRAISKANSILEQRGLRLIARKTEANGRNVRVFEIAEKKPTTPTSFPERKSPKA
jgi:hypothetical protein